MKLFQKCSQKLPALPGVLGPLGDANFGWLCMGGLGGDAKGVLWGGKAGRGRSAALLPVVATGWGGSGRSGRPTPTRGGDAAIWSVPLSKDCCFLNRSCWKWVVDTTGSEPFLGTLTPGVVVTTGTDCFLPFEKSCSSLGAIFALFSLSADDFMGSIPGKGFTSPKAPLGFAGVSGLNGRVGLELVGGFGAGVLGGPMGSSSEMNKFVHFQKKSMTEFLLHKIWIHQWK